MNYGAAWDWWWNWEEWKADIGYSADKSIYDTLNPDMLTAPTTEAQAYDQAAYFIAIATRRADYEGEKEAQDKLWAYLNVVREGKSEEVGRLCSARPVYSALGNAWALWRGREDRHLEGDHRHHKELGLERVG